MISNEGSSDKLVRSEEERMKIMNVALSTPEQAYSWVRDMVRLSADEYYAIRDVKTRVAYWNSVKTASLEEGETGTFWRNYLENSGINL